MRLTFRTKLIAIVGASALAFLLLIIASAIGAARVHAQMMTIQARYLPKLELGPRLESQFERLSRSLQDAVAARDGDALDLTRADKDAMLEALAAGHDVVDPSDAAALRKATEDYYAEAI